MVYGISFKHKNCNRGARGSRNIRPQVTALGRLSSHAGNPAWAALASWREQYQARVSEPDVSAPLRSRGLALSVLAGRPRSRPAPAAEPLLSAATSGVCRGRCQLPTPSFRPHSIAVLRRALVLVKDMGIEILGGDPPRISKPR